ncbi:MAG: hypothetical protein K6E38_07735 [Fretibacterium sp.]|nr:hypothetical protein [Fretibacterium sp.]
MKKGFSGRFNLEGEADELLDRAYESDDEAEVEALVERALELEPDNPEALLLRADLTDDDEERLAILRGALDAVRSVLKEMEIEPEEFAEDELGLVYLALLQRAAFTLFSVGEDDEALHAVEELLCYDLEDNGASRNLYYRILVERGDWQRILTETGQDDDHQLGWAYSRLTAAFMLGERPFAARMFWDALIMSPNVPFYMLGYFPEPEGNSEAEEEDFNFAALYADVWSGSRDLLNWFSRGVILFGLLSGRFGQTADPKQREGHPDEVGDERDAMMEILTSLGGRAEYEAMSALIKDSDDAAIIETLAAHHCLAE